MSGRKALAGLCMLCALALAAFAAPSANAATNGTTLFTCEKTSEGTGERFAKAHCKDPEDTNPNGEYRHVAISESTTTELTGTSENTEGNPIPSILESVQAGIEEELQSGLAHILPENEGSKSWVENSKDPTTGEHYYHGEEWLRYTEVTVKKPAGRGCVVKGGEITSKKVKFTSKGQGMELLFEPAAGTVFAEFTVEGCQQAALNGLYQVTGSVKLQPNGATVNSTLVNTRAQGTLKMRGQVAAIESSTTVKGKDKAAGDESDTPLSPTTVETP